jgi:hypothetical protein
LSVLKSDIGIPFTICQPLVFPQALSPCDQSALKRTVPGGTLGTVGVGDTFAAGPPLACVPPVEQAASIIRRKRAKNA